MDDVLLFGKKKKKSRFILWILILLPTFPSACKETSVWADCVTVMTCVHVCVCVSLWSNISNCVCFHATVEEEEITDVLFYKEKQPTFCFCWKKKSIFFFCLLSLFKSLLIHTVSLNKLQFCFGRNWGLETVKKFWTLWEQDKSKRHAGDVSGPGFEPTHSVNIQRSV